MEAAHDSEARSTLRENAAFFLEKQTRRLQRVGLATKTDLENYSGVYINRCKVQHRKSNGEPSDLICY